MKFFYFKFFEKPKIPSTDIVLNAALKILLRHPFPAGNSNLDRLSKKFPNLNIQELQQYIQNAEKAKVFGGNLVYETMVNRLKALDPMTKMELKEFYRLEMGKAFSWVNKTNLRPIFNLSSYGLWHDGWWEFKK